MLLLEFYRRRRGLSQNELTRRTRVPQTIISEHENGVRDPDAQLRALAAFFGVSAKLAPRLLEPLPDDWDPLARRAAIEAEFADKPEPEAHRKARQCEAAARDAAARDREQTGALSLDEFNERIARGRG